MEIKNKKRERVKPELLGGFRDYLPELMIPRQEIIENIRRTFESFGFLPLDTPALERSSVLGTDIDEFKMEVYRSNHSNVINMALSGVEKNRRPVDIASLPNLMPILSGATLF